MKEYKVLAFSVRAKEYSPGLLKIDEERCQGELLHRKKSFRKEHLVSITKFTYDVKTDPQVKSNTLQVADFSINAESEKDAAELSQLLLSPLKQAYEKSLTELKSHLIVFLMVRAEALRTVDYLKSDFRSQVIRNRTLITAKTADPVKDLLVALTEQMREQLQKIEGVLSSAPERVKASLAEKIYALTCALSAVQDAGLQNDEERGRAAAGLIFAITQVRFEPAAASLEGPTSASRGSVNTDVAGRFLDVVLSSLKDNMFAKTVG